jgi:fluoride exporter
MMLLKNLLLVGLGGMVGSMLRLGVSFAWKSSGFPFATFVVNIIGCFIIGCVYAIAQRNNFFDLNFKLLLTAGLCGGFTTFSAFSWEGFQMLQQNKFGLFAIYVSASILLGLFATWLGFVINR